MTEKPFDTSIRDAALQRRGFRHFFTPSPSNTLNWKSICTRHASSKPACKPTLSIFWNNSLLGERELLQCVFCI